MTGGRDAMARVKGGGQGTGRDGMGGKGTGHPGPSPFPSTLFEGGQRGSAARVPLSFPPRGRLRGGGGGSAGRGQPSKNPFPQKPCPQQLFTSKIFPSKTPFSLNNPSTACGNRPPEPCAPGLRAGVSEGRKAAQFPSSRKKKKKPHFSMCLDF